MITDHGWPWALLLLGATHGINPAMGWLFAVALGLQEKRARAVWRALGPLAAGHALAMAAALAIALALGAVLQPVHVRWLVAALLLAMGVRTLRGHRHVRFGGMRMGARDLTIWSFLMSSAHGAGLMVVPFVLGTSATGATGATGAAHAAHGAHAAHAALVPSLPLAALAATLVHTGAYLLVTGTVAVIVYERLGLRLLRSAWVNLDLVWGVALLATAAITLVA